MRQKHELRLVERRADNEIEDKRPTGPGEGVPDDPISQTGDWLTSLSAHLVIADSLRPRGLWPARLLSMGILQARKLEWVAMSSSRGSSQPRDRTQVSCIAGGFLFII